MRTRLDQLVAQRASGRLDVGGRAGGRVYLDGGMVSCAEQHGQATMLLAMADAGLFDPPEWAAALRVPLARRWSTLVGGDGDRLARLVEFAHDFTAGHLVTLARANDAVACTFVAGASHPLGTLAAWPVGEFLGPVAPGAARAGHDTADFLEMLDEIRPAPRPGR